jgi:zinc protease
VHQSESRSAVAPALKIAAPSRPRKIRMSILTNAPRAIVTRALAAALLLAALAPPLAAQSPAREERLLNGLRVFFFPRPAAQKVWLRLRVGSGAAFDLANKEGMAQLLADALFPDPSTGQYVAEELGGSLDVRADYDAIEITVSGDAARFDALAEVLRNAILQMRLTPDEVRRLKDSRAKSLSEQGETAAARADRAAAARLFASYPYGRPAGGTAASVARVERADLMLARDRLIIPNNSLLAVAGGVDPARAMRTLRQFLGPWRKSEEVPPATFRWPPAPDARTLVIDAPGSTDAEVRIAARGIARSDRDRAAAALLAQVAQQRLRSALREVPAAKLSVGHDSHALGGVFLVSASVPPAQAAQAFEAARSALRSLTATHVTQAELETARRERSAALQSGRDAEYAAAADWLESVAYGHAPSDPARAYDSVTTADLQRVAARLFRDAPLASVVAGDAATLRTALASLPGGIEEPKAAANPPAPPQQRQQQRSPEADRRP